MFYTSDFLKEINSRGFIYQSSEIEELDKLMSKKKITAYIGFDATSDSLHVGSLVQLMLLNWLEEFGHKPIALMGGGTTLIGDPSGKDKTRIISTKNEIEERIEKIKKNFKNFININNGAQIINNYEWLSDINYVDFLRNIGQKITVNKMLTFDSVKSRLDREQPLTFLEFNYMLLQAYDYLHLYNKFNCELQLGGSDQWGNILTGIDLIKRINDKKTFAITSPLITNSDGSKMGKSVNGAIWLSKEKIDNYSFFQFWRNVNDSDVSKFLKLFTKINLTEIEKLSKLKDKEINEAKKILAYEVTKICRGEENAIEAQEISNNIFNKNIKDERILSINIETNKIEENEFTIIDALEKLNLSKSRSDAKRLIKSNGVKINDKQYENNNFSLKNYINEKDIKISVGKKNIGFIKIKLIK